MRALLVDGLPEGLRRWTCDACRSRRWFLDADEITDQEALDLAAGTPQLDAEPQPQ
jgi:hypothetical protein